VDPQLLSSTFEAMPVGVTITRYSGDDSRSGVLIAANKAASANLGMDLAPLIGVEVDPKNFEDYDEEESESLQAMAYEVAVTGRSQVLNALHVRHGPARGTYQTSVFSVGERTVASVFRRIDSEVVAANSLEWAVKATEAANVALSQFASTVAHDLKNPLAGIRGHAELLSMMRVDLPDAAHESVDRLIELAGLSSEMIDGLLRYSRRPVAQNAARVVLDEVLAWVVDVLDEEIRSVGAEVSIGELPVVSGHPSALNQVFLNLIANSLRYRHPDRPAIIEVGRGATDASVAIVDNGIGVPEAERERIFEWGHRAAVGDTQGAGLGLAACKAVLNNLGAEINLGADVAGGGTRMELTFLAP